MSNRPEITKILYLSMYLIDDSSVALPFITPTRPLLVELFSRLSTVFTAGFLRSASI